MRLLSALLVLGLSTGGAVAADAASFKLTADGKSGRPRYTLRATKASLGDIVKEVARQTGKAIEVAPSRQKLPVSLIVVDASEDRLLAALAGSAGLRVAPGRIVRLQLSEPTASIDVKDGDVHAILASLKRQCAIRNLVIDPGVSGKGTFLFRDVPCSEAFSVVFASCGLRGDFGANSTASIAIRR